MPQSSWTHCAGNPCHGYESPSEEMQIQVVLFVCLADPISSLEDHEVKITLQYP
jgi:hypothetical protein